jgi:hypothetical protein
MSCMMQPSDSDELQGGVCQAPHFQLVVLQYNFVLESNNYRIV